MADIKGIVMKTEGSFMWVATADRSFKRYPLPSGDIKPGQEIMVPARPAKAPFSISARAAVAACLLLLFISGLAFTVFPVDSAAAYLAVDINPSLELALDTNNKVIKAAALSEDAKELLRGMKLERLDAYQALEYIIRKSETEGYISDGRENVVLLTIIPVNTQYRQLDTARAKQLVIDQMEKIGAAGSVGIQSSTKEERKNARKEHISVNSYLMLQKASEKGLTKKDKKDLKENTAGLVDDLAKKGMKLNQLMDIVATTPGDKSKKERNEKVDNKEGHNDTGNDPEENTKKEELHSGQSRETRHDDYDSDIKNKDEEKSKNEADSHSDKESGRNRNDKSTDKNNKKDNKWQYTRGSQENKEITQERLEKDAQSEKGKSRPPGESENEEHEEADKDVGFQQHILGKE